MYDIIEKLNHCTIHHGQNNNRIYVMNIKASLNQKAIDDIDRLAQENDYEKIIVKLPPEKAMMFSKSGYIVEGNIPWYYKGEKSCLFMTKYLNSNRRYTTDYTDIAKAVDIAKNKKTDVLKALKPQFKIRKLTTKDVPQMVEVFKKVFKTYPFPIEDPDYVRDTMKSNVVYFGAFVQDQLIGISSCEMNKKSQNVEMTDFAILPRYRGHKLAKHLLTTMENAMIKDGMKLFYTIARATSIPMNSTFGSLGYQFGGTLWNNTQIAGQLESMNLWFKNSKDAEKLLRKIKKSHLQKTASSNGLPTVSV